MSPLENSPSVKKDQLCLGQAEDGTFKITELTRSAVRDICDTDMQSEVKNKEFIMQAVEVRIFTEKDNKKNIRQR